MQIVWLRSCATCHHPAFGYADGLDLSIGAHGVGLGPTRALAAGQISFETALGACTSEAELRDYLKVANRDVQMY